MRREAPRGSGWASLALTPAPQLLMDDGVRAGQAPGERRPYPLWAHQRLPEPSLLPAPPAWGRE